MTKKFDSITGLRAIAAMMVFAYHNRKFWRNSFPDYIDRFINEWHIGVAIFFVLSGFLITYNYFEKLNTLNRTSIFKYISLRFARIYPIYLIIILSKYFFSECPNPLEVFMNVSLLKGYFSKYLLTGLPQSWSLTVETTFYLIVPIYFMLISRLGIIKSTLILILSNLFLIGLGFYLNKFQLNNLGFMSNPNFIIIGTFQGRFTEFIIGVLLGLHLKKIKTFSIFNLNKRNTMIGFGGVFICIITMIQFQTTIWSHGFENHLGAVVNNQVLPIFIALIIKGLATEKTYCSDFLGSKVMVQLGYASFVFYLIHINFINNIVWKFHHFPDRNFVFLWAIALVGYHALEKPIYNYIKKTIN